MPGFFQYSVDKIDEEIKTVNDKISQEQDEGKLKPMREELNVLQE